MKRLPSSVLIVGVIVPVVIAVAASGVASSWFPLLPANVAIHWDASNRPNGFTTPLGFLLMIGVTSVALAALFTEIVMGMAEGGLSIRHKLLLLVSPFITVLLETVMVVSLATQRGLVDAAAAPSPVGALIAGLLLGLVAAVAGWFLLPRARPAEDQYATSPAPTALTPTDRVLWTRSIRSPWWLIALVSGVAVLVSIPAIVSPSPAPWFWALAILATAALLLATLVWRVHVDNSGVVVRSFAGFPRFRLRLADIESATVPVVNPLMEFGGWGIRYGAGRRVGVILTSGDALEVHRTNGSSVVVTVDDAVGAASLINGLVARARLDTERR